MYTSLRPIIMFTCKYTPCIFSGRCCYSCVHSSACADTNAFCMYKHASLLYMLAWKKRKIGLYQSQGDLGRIGGTTSEPVVSAVLSKNVLTNSWRCSQPFLRCYHEGLLQSCAVFFMHSTNSFLTPCFCKVIVEDLLISFDSRNMSRCVNVSMIHACLIYCC